MDGGAWVSLGTLVVGLVIFAIGLVQYRKAQQWKVAEFVANEFKDFERDLQIDDALTMLDWNPIKMPLAAIGDGKQYEIDHQMIGDALRDHMDVPSGFPQPLAGIRMTFDYLFGRLGRFEHYICRRANQERRPRSVPDLLGGSPKRRGTDTRGRN